MNVGRRWVTRTAAVMCATAILFMGGVQKASATPLLPGDSFVPVPIGTGPAAGDVQLASMMGSATAGAVTAFIRAAVYRNVAGFLDFYFQLRNDSSGTPPEIIARETDFDYMGFTTDISQSSTPFSIFVSPGAANTWQFADRNFSGSTVGFDLPLGAGGGLAAGMNSYIKKIATNATLYQPGFTSAIDGGTATVVTFSPMAAPVPEPASLTLLGLGLVGLGRAARRRIKR